MQRRIPSELTARARALRNNPTPAEFAVWRRISCYRPAFTRQLVEAPFIIDSAFLRAKGWRILRLWNSDVLSNPDGAVQHILAQAAECLGGTHPQPLPSREGRDRRPRFR
jgi:very-short-patch-repair endonuclease